MNNLASIFYRHFVRERDRWVLWLPVCLGLGVGGYFSLLVEPSLWLSMCSIAGLGFAAFVLRAKFSIFVGLIACFAIALGFGAA